MIQIYSQKIFGILPKSITKNPERSKVAPIAMRRKFNGERIRERARISRIRRQSVCAL